MNLVEKSILVTGNLYYIAADIFQLTTYVSFYSVVLNDEEHLCGALSSEDFTQNLSRPVALRIICQSWALKAFRVLIFDGDTNLADPKRP